MGGRSGRILAALAVLTAVAACSSPAPGPSGPSPSWSRSPVTRSPDPFPSSTPDAPLADPGLPFDPSVVVPRPGRLVLAHYLPAFTVSIDNEPAASDYYTTGYLAPGGEHGKHAAYGGFLRDRPLPRPPRISPRWQLLDLEDEVRTASAAGLDGFALDLVELPGDPDVRVLSVQDQLVRAATVVPGFRILLMPDMSGSLRHRSVDEVASYVARLARSSSVMRLGDGRLVVSPYLAENRSVGWWKDFASTMASRYGQKVALVPLFADVRDHAREFAAISYGMSTWGARNPAQSSPAATSPDSPVAQVDAVHALGKLWMQPVSVQDERPSQGVFDEALNTENLRDTWQIARDADAEWVQVATWNDYAEGTQIAPSVKRGRTLLDLVSYYAAWFKSGTPPAVVQDALYLTHRIQRVAAKPSYPQWRLMRLREGSSPARDSVEVLAFLTAPATVEIVSGGRTTRCALPAGVQPCLAPLGTGTVTARAVRGGAAVASVVSPYPVVAVPRVQDLQYVAASSLRS